MGYEAMILLIPLPPFRKGGLGRLTANHEHFRTSLDSPLLRGLGGFHDAPQALGITHGIEV